MNPSLLIGYPTLEAWARIVVKDEPVYAMLLTEPGPIGTHGSRTDDLLIVCVQPDAHNRAHYCRILVGRLTFINSDQPFNPDAETRKDQAEQAWDLVKDWLWEQDFDVREAALATPVNYRYLNGVTEFLEFDPKVGFYRKDILSPFRAEEEVDENL